MFRQPMSTTATAVSRCRQRQASSTLVPTISSPQSFMTRFRLEIDCSDSSPANVAGIRLQERCGRVLSSWPSMLNQRCAYLDLKARSYSTTSILMKGNKSDDSNNDKSTSSSSLEIETLNNTQYSQEELEAIIEAEEARLAQEEADKFVPNWKPGMRKRPLLFSRNLEDLIYELQQEELRAGLPISGGELRSAPWTLLDKRCGALAIKVGMVPIFDPVWGIRYPCTVLLVDRNIVVGHKTVERHGYDAIQVAAGQRKGKNVSKPVLGQYKHLRQQQEELLESEPTEENDINQEELLEQEQQLQRLQKEFPRWNPPFLMREFRVSDPSHLIPVLTPIHARHFVPGQNVDVTGISKGKGFQGPMKRHGFAGLPASHGVSRAHRSHGSTGQCQDPGRVFKGKKMAGHMGVDQVTVQNLRVLRIDRGRNLLYVVGAVPGNKGEFVQVKDAVKKPLWKTASVMDELDRPPLPTYDYDAAVDGTNQVGFVEWMPMPQQDPTWPEADDMAA